ncbi:c-type cytochrome [PVC group bacterium]|nr:c-type cytochrome [PVC group bacterium]
MTKYPKKILKNPPVLLIGIVIFVLLGFLLWITKKAESQGSYKEKPQLTQELFQRGQELYQKQCSVCHGATGEADGRAAYLLSPKPRDFVQDKFRLVSTTSLEATHEDLFDTITQGMPGSAMPSWGHLAEADRWALVYYIRYLSELDEYQQNGEITEKMLKDGLPWEWIKKIASKEIDPDKIINVPFEPEVTQEALKRGQELFVASCASCHGDKGTGDGQNKSMFDNMGYPVKPRDLTAGIFKGGSSSEALYKRMVGGIPGSPMPSYSDAFTQEQIWELIHFIQTLTDPKVEERAQIRYLKLNVPRIEGDLDLDPFADYWSNVKPVFVSLMPLWWRDDRIEGVDVKVLHNGDKIAFYLTWADPKQDNNIVEVQSFSDGAALQFSLDEDPPFFGMGSRDHPVHIWHWKAAWEQRGDERKDIETEYPHTATDFYESQKNYKHGSPFETAESKTKFHDPKFMTGQGAGNPLSNPHKKEAVEEGVSEGLGSYTVYMPKIEEVKAQGIWKDGEWHVVFIRSLKPSKKGAYQFKPGKRASVAFAIWDGAHKDRNGQKMVSIWNQLILDQ